MKVSHQLRVVNEALVSNMEIFEIKPVLLGGSPTESRNKIVLSRADHIKAVCFWNKVVAELRATDAPTGSIVLS